MMMINIRACKKDDYEGICILVKQLHFLHVKNRGDFFKDTEQVFSMEDFIQILNEEESELFVIENEKEIIGYSNVKITQTPELSIVVKRKIAYIGDICIENKFKRKGLGKLLFNHIIDFAKSKKVDAIELMVWEFNKEAIKFYESVGFTTKNRKLELKLK